MDGGDGAADCEAVTLVEDGLVAGGVPLLADGYTVYVIGLLGRVGGCVCM